MFDYLIQRVKMENSAYVPNTLPPSLVVFSQSGSLSEALRMQRPFHPQTSEAKELHSLPFSAASFGLRPLEGYPGLPAHLLHLQPHFIHPALEHRLPFGGGAFRPLSDEGGAKFPSAFAPPNKCAKLEPTSLFSPMDSDRGFMNGGQQRSGASCSPNSTSPTMMRIEEDGPSEERDGTATPASDVTERSTPDEGRGYRRRKKQEPSSCPVCSVTLRTGEVESHFVQELDRLYKLGTCTRSRSGCSTSPAPTKPSPGPSTNRREGGGACDSATPEARWEAYQRIKVNRQTRLRAKTKKKRPDEVTCPVCSERVQGTVEELNSHVEHCLRRNDGSEEGVEVDIEGDGDTFEEYEWAGQRRIRASSLLPGGFAGMGLATARRCTEEDEGELVVDGDDSATFGPSQYSESDIVMCSVDEPREEREREALREAVISPDGCRQTPPAEGCAPTSSGPPDPDHSVGDSGGGGSEDGPETCSSHVMEALKSRVRELEAEHRTTEERFRCLICMEKYRKPVVSICCWHVHCEECWLYTLGAKKLCPQCNMITSPSDLRRIYL